MNLNVSVQNNKLMYQKRCRAQGLGMNKSVQFEFRNTIMKRAVKITRANE